MIIKKAKKIDTLQQLVGQKFGRFLLKEVNTIKSTTSNRNSFTLNFICDCGVNRTYSHSKATNIFKGTTKSCGCLRKEKWAKSYYSWKKDWTQKGLL